MALNSVSKTDAGLPPRFNWNDRIARFKDRFEDFRKNRLAFVGIIIVTLVILIAILAPVIQIHDPLEQNIGNRLQKPNIKHIFGTDHFGRDVWARIVKGARVALLVGIIAVGIG